MAARTGTWNHDIKGNRRTTTGQYVYSTRTVRQVPTEAQKNPQPITAEDLTFWGKDKPAYLGE